MTSILLRTFNHYAGGNYTAAQAIEKVKSILIFPLPEPLPLRDWRAHVPMHFLEDWQALADGERVAIYIMAQSATHPYEKCEQCDGPTMN